MTIQDKNISRFTFDCPADLHSVAKMKAAARKISLREYLIGLLIKDISEGAPQYVDKKSFRNEVEYLLKNDAELMRKLADR